MNTKLFTIASFLVLTSLSGSCLAQTRDSLDLKIAQMLLIGFRGMSLQETDPFLKDVKAGRVGSVILFDYDVPTKEFKRNIESPQQVRGLTAQLAKAARESNVGLPLFISIDQEGGRVNRLKPRYGFPPSVSQQYLGKLNNMDSTRFYAAKTAQTLAENGFNLNFAPSVDVNVNPENPVIGKIERSFSAEPSIVASQAAVIVEEHRKKKVITTLKHFPGHGSSKADSHKGFVDVSDTWKPDEIKPYAELIRQNKVDMIMTAHIFNNRLDADVPATLSKRVITGILRDSLKYQGVVISDDMQMGAIADHYGLDVALEKCINAGVDIVCFGNNLQYDPDIITKASSILKRLVLEGKISRARVDESYRRIVALKQKL
ncbi:MAG: glycoside hydrolase family 3 [Candidatus Kapaibacterium sp.]|nr:MAG: glycoside hydrolase family 3 [Candidatus Kapabacteria bacterium]